ncbi:MAG TPA: twin-arginine translocation signal domain-containing protein, partial [Polyangia bacterium]|nr:twin-arginine translocation signal domain-containing protein [Polyangia bacterium]
MATDSQPKRRDFLKTAAVGAAGAMGLGALKFDRAAAQTAGTSAWVNGMAINPAIDNRRVICCHDPKMLTSLPKDTSFATTNAAVDAAVVATNLDQLAMQLTRKTSATDAWSTIFRSSKSWTSTRVAMKTNGIGGSTTNRPKWAIFKKICDVLINLGVQPANIILFDACDNAATYYDSHISLTDSTMIRAAKTSVRAAGMGGFKAANLTNAAGMSVAADLMDGNIDILVNIAACKSHNGTGGKFSYGSCTLCMKHHFGTFTDPAQAQHSNNLHVANSGATPPPPPLALFEINKHVAVLGGNPVRQQLCIVDALLSNGQSGPGGAWDNRTDRLVMGTFAPIVDYCAAKNILLNATLMSSAPIPALGQTNAAIILPMFLTNFGYTTTDPDWLEYEA